MTTRAEDVHAPTGRLPEEPAERERAEASLTGILRAWNATLDAMEDLISLHDWGFRIARANRALARRLGCEPAQLIGKPCYRVFHGTDAPPPDCPHSRARLTGRSASQGITESLIGIPLRVTCSPYCDENGRPVGTVHVARDVSEEKRREEEREALIAELQEALAQAKILRGLLPICSSCKRIRDDRGYWNQIEAYIRERSDVDFTHGICPECAEELYPHWVNLQKRRGG